MKKISKAIVNRLTKNAGSFGIICGNIENDMERTGVAIVGAYYGLAIVGDRPENTPNDNNAERAQGFYNNTIAAARMNCTKQLVTPNFKALQMYDRTERKAKTKRPYNFGAGMPAVNPQFLTDILSLDKSAKIYYNKPNVILYIAGNGFEAVLMPVKKPKDRPDIATDLTEYGAEPTTEPAQDVKPETVKPWFLRADADANAKPIPLDVYTAADTAEPAPAAEPPEEPAKPKAYKAEDLNKIMKTAETHVKYTGRTVKKYNEEGYYISYGARFVEGAFYKVPESCKKSRAAEIIFRVDRNTGKSLTVTAWEKYNNEITETTHKNKKLNPGSKYFWLHVDPETGKTVNIYSVPDEEREKYIDFTYWECIDIEKLSRWTSGTLSVIDAEPITAAEFEAFKNAEPAEEAPKASGITVTTRAKDYDYTPKYYPVSEHLARLHKEAISFYDYKEGSQTAEYKNEVDSVYKLARNSGDPEKSLYLADVFAKRLARWFDDMNRNGASCPSVMIAGPANFPVRKKERQNARHDTLMHQYSKIMNLKNKIAHPHGVEIIRDEIGNEFENVLYFTAVISKEENRLQLIFGDKPEENVRTILKKNGFRWSGRFKAWQRQLTENAICAAWCVVDALDKIEEEEAENAAKIGA